MTEYHSFEPAKEVVKDGICVQGSFSPAGTGAVTSVTGRGFTVARTDVGNYTVTVEFPFEGVIDADARLRMATAEVGSHETMIGTVSTSARTFVIVHKYSADTSTTHPVDADIAAAAANVVSFSLKLVLSDVPGSGLP